MSHLHILYIWNDLKNLQKPFYFQIPEYAKDAAHYMTVLSHSKISGNAYYITNVLFPEFTTMENWHQFHVSNLAEATLLVFHIGMKQSKKRNNEKINF